jgi:xanthosine utilization system XapX-like protein
MKVNWNLVSHIAAQILAQGAVYALLKDHSPEAIYAAVVAVIGIVVAYYDLSSAKSTVAPVAPTEPTQPTAS